METYYLVDFENVHDEGVANIATLSKDDHIHIFFTKNANKGSMDIMLANGKDIVGHKVADGDQSLDKHLLSYLGYLLGMNKEKTCSYVIVSKDKGYDKVIKFWLENGFVNISRKTSIPKVKAPTSPKTKTPSAPKEKAQPTKSAPVSSVNEKISAGMSYDLSGEDRSELNKFMQHELKKRKYKSDSANRICKYVIAHCNDERILRGIHNDLQNEFSDYADVYEDVKKALDLFVTKKSKKAKREAQVRSVYGRNFKKKVYVQNKEETIDILVNAKTRQAVNNSLLKLYGDSDIVKAILTVYQPLLKDLPGR